MATAHLHTCQAEHVERLFQIYIAHWLVLPNYTTLRIYKLVITDLVIYQSAIAYETEWN